jgi:hypothetical protein
MYFTLTPTLAPGESNYYSTSIDVETGIQDL